MLKRNLEGENDENEMRKKTFKYPLLLELTALYFPSVERFTKRHYLHFTGFLR